MPDAASAEDASSTPNGPFFNIDGILGKNSGSDEANFQQLFKPNVRNIAAPVFKPLLRPGSRPASVRTACLPEQGDQQSSSASREVLSVSKADSEDRSAATISPSTRKFVPLLRSKGGRAPFRQLTQCPAGPYECPESRGVQKLTPLATLAVLQPQPTITQGQSANMPDVVSSQASSRSSTLKPNLAHVVVPERRDGQIYSSPSASTTSIGDEVDMRQKITSAEIFGEEKPKGIRRILTPAVPRANLGSIQRPSIRNLPSMHAAPLLSAATDRQMSTKPSSTSNASELASATPGVERQPATTTIRERSQNSALIGPSLGEGGQRGSKPEDINGVSPTDMEVSRDPFPRRPITPQRPRSRSTLMFSREDDAYHSPPATPQMLAAHATRGGELARKDEPRGCLMSSKRIHSGSTMQPPVPQNLFELSQKAVQRADIGTPYQRPSIPTIEARDWKTICATITQEMEQATGQALVGIEQDNRFTLRQQMELDQIDRTIQILRSEIADQRARILNMACDMLILLRHDDLRPAGETRDAKKRKRNEMDERRDASPLEASQSIPVVVDAAHALKLTPLDSQTVNPVSDHVSSSGEAIKPIANTNETLPPISTVKHDKQDSDSESVDLM
ncbi:hypothetical protein SpCBS45565_g08235 [Spizellomyces sp. 'palustris']|nr:hypothetical protein SpCBS45565_g08235 [Spizellomyces sp. 'palustris']